MADPIPTAIETLRILIEQAPYYAQTPQAQKVVEWVNETLDAIKQYNENHGSSQVKAQKELKNLQKILKAAPQIAPPVSPFDINESTPPEEIMKRMAKHARAEGRQNIKSLGESQREIQEQARQWQEQLRQASLLLQESITNAQQQASITVYGTRDPDIARQEQQLEISTQSEQRGGIFRMLLGGLGMVDDLLILPVIFVWEKIKKGAHPQPAPTELNPNPNSVKPVAPGISDTQSAAPTIPGSNFTVPEKAVTASNPNQYIDGGTSNPPNQQGQQKVIPDGRESALPTNLAQGNIVGYKALKTDTTTAVGPYDPELARLMEFAEQQRGGRGSNDGNGLNRFGKTRQPGVGLPERHS